MRSEHETTFGDVNTLLGAAPYVRCNELQGSLRKRLLFKIKITEQCLRTLQYTNSQDLNMTLVTEGCL